MEAIPETKVRALIYLKQDGHEITWDCELDWAEVNTNGQMPPITTDRHIPGILPDDFSIRGKPRNVAIQAGSGLFESELRRRFDELWIKWAGALTSYSVPRELALKFWLTAHGLEA